DGPAHVRHTIGRLTAALDGAQVHTLADVNADAVLEWLAGRREARPVVPLPTGAAEVTPAEVAALLGVPVDAARTAVRRHGLAATGNGKARRLPRATAERLVELAARGDGETTTNHYVTALRGFGNWLVKGER